MRCGIMYRQIDTLHAHMHTHTHTHTHMCFPGASDGKESACNPGDSGSIPGLGRPPGEGNGNPLQYSWWKIPWTEEAGELQSMGLQKLGHDWETFTSFHIYIYIHIYIYVCVCTNKKRLKTCLLKGYNSEFLKWGRSVGVIHCFRAIITTASLPTAIISILHWWAASVSFMYITSNSYRKLWP